MSSAAALLLADAEPETRGFLERHLPDDGFELVGAGSRFDLVLAGDVAGVDRWVDRAPVIVLGSEQADAVDRIHAFRHGCDDYVARPFEYEELVAFVSGCLPQSAQTSFQVGSRHISAWLSPIMPEMTTDPLCPSGSRSGSKNPIREVKHLERTDPGIGVKFSVR